MIFFLLFIVMLLYVVVLILLLSWPKPNCFTNQTRHRSCSSCFWEETVFDGSPFLAAAIMIGSKEYNFQLKQHERFRQAKYNYIQYDNHLSSQLFLALRRSMLKIQDDSLKATELAYKSIGLLAKFVIVTFSLSYLQKYQSPRMIWLTDVS